MGTLGRVYSRYQNYVLSRKKACGDMAGFPSCKDGDPKDVRAGTFAYRLDWIRHPIQHIVYEKLGYVSEEESRPRIEKGDFIMAARDKRLASALDNLEGIPVAEAVTDFDPEIRRPAPANCGLGEIVGEGLGGAKKKVFEVRPSDTKVPFGDVRDSKW